MDNEAFKEAVFGEAKEIVELAKNDLTSEEPNLKKICGLMLDAVSKFSNEVIKGDDDENAQKARER